MERTEMKKLLLSFCFLSLLICAVYAQKNIEISLKNNTEKEIQTKKKLLDLINRYNLSKWIFTQKVLIDEQVRIPHSHPVLTLNTRYMNDDLRMLSVFVHEQIHWHEEGHAEQRDKAIKELESIFPVIPTSSPEAARDRNSTYLHLIVCYSEYEAMKELAGADKAREIMQSWTHYTWVYKTVLTETEKIKAVVEKYKLKI
jgi:hypothetical protein